MTIVADFPFDSNVIVVLVAVIFTAIKAFLERGKTPDPGEETSGEELYEQQREEERPRQRETTVMPAPVARPPAEYQPPPIPQRTTRKPIVPKLSAAEKKALENLQNRSPRRKTRSYRSTKSRVHRHLSSPTAAREALLLAEILGPPKALKDER